MTRTEKKAPGYLHPRYTLFMLAVCLLLSVVILPAKALATDRTDWMKYLPDTMPITEINMPGTHDSGTQYMHTASFQARCQSMSIKQQLENGMRVLDLRLDEYGGDTPYDKAMYLMLNHNGWDAYRYDWPYQEQLLFKDVLADVQKFLKEHPKETVVLICSAEGDDKDKARYILYDFASAYRYNRTTLDKDWADKGYWLFDFVRAYFPGDPVPTLGKARGKAIVLLDQAESDNKSLAAFRSFESYEMHYEYDTDLKEDIQNKLDYVKKLFTDAVENNWKPRYYIEEFGGKQPVFGAEKQYGNETGKTGNPIVKYSGTNVTQVREEHITGHGPSKCADWFWDGLRAIRNWDDWIQEGYRYGWITMDFPERYWEFTEAIIESNFGIVNQFKMAIQLNSIQDGIYVLLNMPKFECWAELDNGARLEQLTWGFSSDWKNVELYFGYYSARQEIKRVVLKVPGREAIFDRSDYVQWPASCLYRVRSDVFTLQSANVMEPMDQSINVKLSWSGSKSPVPGSVEVQLYADGKLASKQTITKDSGWSVAFANQPIYRMDSNGLPILKDGQLEKVEYTLHTSSAEGYMQTITGNAEMGFTVVYAGTPDIPQTGDKTNLPLLAGMLVLSMGAMAVLLRKRKTM